MFCVLLLKLCCFKWEKYQFEHMIYFTVEKYEGRIREGATIGDNTVSCYLSCLFTFQLML